MAVQRESETWVDALPDQSLGQYWTLRALGPQLPSKWALIFVFPILVITAGGWTVGVCFSTCPAILFSNTMLATS